MGDAGFVKDPVTAQGISDAFRDADLLTDAIDAGFSGKEPLEAALAGYENQRNAASKEMYEFTAQVASLAPPVIEQRVLFSCTPRQARDDQPVPGRAHWRNILPGIQQASQPDAYHRYPRHGEDHDLQNRQTQGSRGVS